MDDPGLVADNVGAKGWARLWAAARPFARPTPRAGAWYPVLGDASGERAVLEVRGKRVAVAKKFLEFRSDRPRVFTVVVRSRDTAENVLQDRGARIERIYAVCPVCSERVHVLRGQTLSTCPKCAHAGEIAWWETG
jgi:hypothetical protein